MLNSARSGAWITRHRLRAYCAILLAFYTIAVLALVGTSNGLVDRWDRPLGTDFSEVYAAGASVLKGAPAAPYDNAAHLQMQREIFGPKTPFFAWSYPPYFLGLAALFALLPYLGSLAVWQASTLALYVSAIRKLAFDRDWQLATLAFPGAFITLIQGQNAFLTAGLFAWSLIMLESRPTVAGVLIGLLAYKPQFGVLIPIALIAGRHWRAIGAAIATIAAMTLATWIAFGENVWRGFFVSTTFARVVLTEQGATGFFKIQTIFSAVRQLGGSVALAYGTQAVSALACATIVALMWRRRADLRLKSAALMTGALLSTPYALDYDMALLGPALAFMASYVHENGARPWDKTILAVVWAAPLIARPAALVSHLSLGVAAMVLFMGMIARAGQLVRTTATSATPERSQKALTV